MFCFLKSPLMRHHVLVWHQFISLCWFEVWNHSAAVHSPQIVCLVALQLSAKLPVCISMILQMGLKLLKRQLRIQILMPLCHPKVFWRKWILMNLLTESIWKFCPATEQAHPFVHSRESPAFLEMEHNHYEEPWSSDLPGALMLPGTPSSAWEFCFVFPW